MTSGSIARLRSIVGSSPTQTFELSADSLTIGRDASSSQIVVQGEGVSRAHARVARDGDGFVLHDLGSSNGTFVNGQRLAGPHRLRSGDRIRLGQSVELAYEFSAPAAPATRIEPIVEAASPPAPPPVVRPAAPAAVPPPVARHAAPASGIGLGQTVLGDLSSLPSAPAEPPELVVETAGSGSQTIRLTAGRYALGRAEDNEIVIASKIVSRRHARLERADGGYQLTVLPDAGNPILFEGRPLTAPRRLRHNDKLRIGGMDPGLMVTLIYRSPSEAADAVRPIAFGDKTRLQIGRDASNDVTLDVPQVSRFHAVVERVGQRYRVTDLRSSNGTFVNDERIVGHAWLKPDDTIRIGAYRFVVGTDRLAQVDESSGLRVEVLGLNKWVRKDLNILQDISLVMQPREFVVVVGQSGGGKSTLVDSIAGYRPATHGRVLVNGIDVYRHFDAVRNEIGFVPQRDIIHMELTVYQALDYAAQLRMPRDTTSAERHRRVMAVLEDLDLTHRKDVQISGLSGGQQKRVSIGVELLTRPGLFFLDEPTSGLDPGTETALMQLMRRLADQGRTIVLITHATKNVMLADKVVFLARGGYLAWFGPPEEALRYFNQFRSARDQRAAEMEFDTIYAILDDPQSGSPAEWAKRFQAHPAYQEYVVRPLKGRGAQPAAAAPRASAGRRLGRAVRRPISSLRQFVILSSRNIKILTRDRFSLALMLAAAPLAGMLDVVLAVLLGRDPFSSSKDGHVANVMITLFLLTLYGVMVGGLAQMREIVKEQDIYKRERLVNLKIVPYVLSKVWVAGLLALYQSVAYVVIHFLAFDMPGGIVEVGLVYITLTMATMAGMMLGLFSSALAPNANSAPLIVVLFMLPQIVLGGALIPLPGPGQFVSGMTSTRWAYEALMGITGVGSDPAADVCWLLPESERELMTLEDKEANCRCMGTNLFSQCQFPGLGRFYHPAIDQEAPVAPPPLRDPPPEPGLPPRPEEPADQSDQVAMADFFDKLKTWEAEVNEIQAEYRTEVQAYQAETDVYKAEAIAYQEDLAKWQIARAAAVEPAEGLIGQVKRDFGWTFVNKNDPTAYWPKLISTWLAQGLITAVLFAATLVLQKRKDVIA